MLRKFALLENLDSSQLEQLGNICDRRIYQPQEFLFLEEEKEDIIYFLVSGTVGLYRSDSVTHKSLKFKEMSSGESLGEMSFVDSSPRSCSVKAETEVVALLLSRQKLIDNIPQHQDILNIFNETINYQINEHLRTLTDHHILALQQQIEDLKEREKLSHFLFLLIFGFFTAIAFAEFLKVVPDNSAAESTFFHWIYLIIVGLLPAILLFIKVDIPFKKLLNIQKGFTKSLLDGLIFSAVSVIVIFVLCVILNPIFPEKNFLQNFLSMSFPIATLFYFIHSYIQQFLRAIVQVLIQRFLLDRKGYISVMLTALSFGIVHAQYGFESMMVTFIVSIFFGLIYRRTYNLLGVSMVHFVLGSIYFHMGQ